MQSRSVFGKVAFLGALLSFPVSALAVATVSVAPSGDSTFAVRASGFDSVGGIKLVISYDANLLKKPQVTVGNVISNSLYAINDGTPGSITLAALSTTPLPREGTIVNVTFTRTGASLGGVNVSGNAANSVAGGPAIALAFNGYTPPQSADGTSDSGSNSGNNSGSGSGNNSGSSPSTTTSAGATSGTGSTNTGGYGTLAGTITLPTDEMAPRERRAQAETPPPEAGAPEAPPEVPAPPSEENVEQPPPPEPQPQEGGTPPPAAKEEPQRQESESVLERFRLFQGECTVQNLVALFDRESAPGFRQDPPIALSDGAEVVTVTIGGVKGEKTPNFTFQGAKHVSMKRSADGAWQVQAKPNQGAVLASVTVVWDGQQRVFPLTVAPRVRVDLAKPGKVDPADFELFLKERGTAEAPKHDLNGDGKRDYIDDYIFTANYLLAQKGKVNRPAAEQKAPAVKKPPAEKKGK